MARDVKLVQISRKWVVTWLLVTIGLAVFTLGSYLYTNYIAKQLCGVISISLDAYKANPNPSVTGKTLRTEFEKISKRYHC